MQTQSLVDRKILIVSEERSRAQTLADMLSDEGYSHVQAIGEPRETQYQCSQWEPDLLLLDLDLADADPFAIARALRKDETDDGAPEIVGVTGVDDDSALRRALEEGIDGFVRKPVDRLDLAMEVRGRLMIRALSARPGRDAEETVEAMDRELERAQIGVLQTLARLVEYRDFKTERHAERVGELSAKIAAELGMPEDEIEMIRDAAPLHDVGMVVVPDHILLKESGLTPEERKIMMTHAANGARILAESALPVMELASVIAHTHHERWDGEGYPRGLEGDDIPLAGRIVAVADTFEAITHDRPFREAESAERALEEIRNERGQQFDPDVVDALLRVREREPTAVQ